MNARRPPVIRPQNKPTICSQSVPLNEKVVNALASVFPKGKAFLLRSRAPFAVIRKCGGHCSATLFIVRSSCQLPINYLNTSARALA